MSLLSTHWPVPTAIGIISDTGLRPLNLCRAVSALKGHRQSRVERSCNARVSRVKDGDLTEWIQDVGRQARLRPDLGYTGSAEKVSDECCQVGLSTMRTERLTCTGLQRQQ